ncbi:MAG: organic solvent tolerance protein [Halioglobus sp.]|nr:organic solvent tolerance protein [Halioglobus sp.]
MVLGLAPTSGAQDSNPQHDGESGSAQADTPAVQRQLDWVELENVPEALRDRQCIHCQGRYIDPLAGEDTGQSPAQAKISARADSSQIIGDEAVLTGNVTAQQGYRRISGDRAVVDREQESALISGNVTLREPGVLLVGEQAEGFSRTGEATLESGRYLFHERHMRGAADLLERDEEGLIHIHDGNFSYCAPGENDWAIRADLLELDFEEGLGTAHDAKIDVEGVPVFYFPWLRFPLDDRRRTGFLWPDFGSDSTGGLDITVPFYMNLAPNYDALYSPRYIEERGLNHELLLRYLNPVAGKWTLGGAWMGDDDRYSDQVPGNRSTDRWLGVVKQNGLYQQRWRSRVDYSKASDVDYLKDLETSNLDSQRRTSLLQLASLDYLGDSWLVNLQAQQFQSLANDINEDYKKLPQLTAQYWGRGTPFELEPVIVSQVSNFDSDEDRVTGQRVYAEAGLTYPMNWLFGSLQPTVKYRQLYYDLSETTLYPEDSPSAGSALASLDGSLFFDRKLNLGGRDLLQTLEPRLYYLYSEYEDQTDQPDFDSAELTFTYNQLFRETRFSGRDRLDDANQIAVGLTTSFIDETDGTSLASASIGQIYYFRDRKVRLLPTAEALDDSGSEIAGELSLTPDRHWQLRSSLVYDPFDDKVNSGHFVTSYYADNGGIYNIGYSFRRPLTTVNTVVEQPNTAEASVSAYLPVSENWSLFGAMNYSTQANKSVEDMIGVEYDSCCWTLRLLYLRYFNNESNETVDFNDPNLERENTAQFQIILKGMGGFGDRITDIMKDMIRGFEERDY